MRWILILLECRIIRLWNGSLSLLLDNMNDISSRYDKDVLVAETSIGYTTETFGCNGIVYSKEHEKIIDTQQHSRDRKHSCGICLQR